MPATTHSSLFHLRSLTSVPVLAPSEPSSFSARFRNTAKFDAQGLRAQGFKVEHPKICGLSTAHRSAQSALLLRSLNDSPSCISLAVSSSYHGCLFGSTQQLCPFAGQSLLKDCSNGYLTQTPSPISRVQHYVVRVDSSSVPSNPGLGGK